MLVSTIGAAALGTLMLRLAARWLHKIDLPFGMAFMIVLLSGMTFLLMSVVLIVGVKGITGTMPEAGQAIGPMVPVGLMAATVIVHWLGRIPLRMACTTTLSAAAMSVCVVFAVALGARILWVTVLATNSD
jgi:hypothetical protein